MRKIFCLVTVLSLTIFNSMSQKGKGKPEKPPVFVKTASGLEYAIIKKGTGVQPVIGDKVTVHYTGKLTNDTVFDSSYRRNQPFSFKLGVGQVIKGWDEGIALLHAGDKAILRIPAVLGYGERASPTIPANSALVFDVELISVDQAPKPYDVKGKDTINGDEGLRYILVKENKAGQKANRGDKVTVHYTGYFADGKVFDSSVERGSPFSFPLGMSKVIRGWDLAFSILRKGEKARIILPSSIAYGDGGSGPIPGGATLIFDVEFIDITAKTPIPQYDTKGKDTVTTASGLKYIVVSTKNSPMKAGAGKQIAAHYTGYFSDGKMFESSLETGQPIQFVLGNNMVIPGWEEGLSLMSMGDKYRLIIPSNLAYGANGAPPTIPPNATLVFDIEMLIVTDPVKPSESHEGHDHNDPNHKH